MKLLSNPFCLLGFTAFLASVGCDSEPAEDASPPIRTAADPEPEKDDSGSESDDVSSSLLQTFDGMSFFVPEGWEQQQLSQMQQGIISAKFGMPGISADLSVTLSVSGGGRESNISRWKGQFAGGPPAVEEVIRTAGGDADLIRLTGQFSPGFGRPSEDNWSMIGAIMPVGPQHYFVKLTGPASAVEDVESEFLEFCESARPE